MKRLFLWTLTALLTLQCGLTTLAQQRTFRLTDTTFEIGAIHILPQLVYNICLRYGDTFMTDNQTTIDSLADFFKANPRLTIEIGSHTEQIGSTEYNLKLSERLSKNLKKLLVDKGIKRNKIKTKGYGEAQPIIEQHDIDKLLNENDKRDADQTNRRIELKIIGT